jgi:large subunit ribosomal protein L18
MRTKLERHGFRTLRVRNNIRATSQYPRLSVYRSLKHIYAQIIDDVQGRTLAAASSKQKDTKVSGIKAATLVGQTLAQKAVKNGVTQVVFDRGGRPYHGRVKALADAAREAGLKF